MPELPEVETIVRDIRPHLVGSTLRNPQLFKADVLRDVSRERFLETVTNARVTDVIRRAKHIVVHLQSGPRLLIQLRMTGNLMLVGRRQADALDYVVFRASVGARRSLVYRDVRRLGTITLLNEAGWQAYTERVGPEPLADDFTPDVLGAALAGTRQAVKKAIMDQTRVAGVGNIYANEALFLARIDPSKPGNRLSAAQVGRLHGEIRQVLQRAIERGGTTFRDYRTGTGEIGAYQHVLRVYGRDGEPCFECGTRLHTTHAIDGRATTICWRCQGIDPS